MNYTQQEYENLVAAVEADGGEVLPDMCEVKEYEFSGPKKVKQRFLPGCGNTDVICEIPYESPKNGLQPIRLCAVCDDLGATPRYRSAVMG